MTALTTENLRLNLKGVAYVRYETNFVLLPVSLTHRRDIQKAVKAESNSEDELGSDNEEPPAKKAKKAPAQVKVSRAHVFLANAVNLAS